MGLALLVGVAYRPAVRFGLMWDDPIWFRQGAGRSLPELFAGIPDYQFYRPLMLAYNRLWWLPGGRLDAVGLHAAQIACHAAVVLLSWLLARSTGLGRSWAVLSAMLVALFPFSHQAVAWAQAQQPLVTVLLLLSILGLARASDGLRRRDGAPRGTCHGRAAAYGGSVLCYGMALWLHEVAAAFIPVLLLVAWGSARGLRSREHAAEQAERAPGAGIDEHVAKGEADGRRGGHDREAAAEGGATRRTMALTAPFVFLVLLYGLARLRASLLPGVTGGGYDAQTAAFLGQAVALPVARLIAVLGGPWPVGWLLAGWALTALVLVVALWRLGERDRLVLGGLWVACGLLPVWAGLSYDYVALGQRLVYPAVPGIALLWATLASRLWDRTGGTAPPAAAGAGESRPLAAPSRARVPVAGMSSQRGLLVLAVTAVLLTSGHDVWLQNRLYAVGTSHLAAAVAVLRDPTRRAVFVNFPDRLALRRPPFPAGYWGLTLAPIVVELDDYARVLYARAGRSESWSLPVVGAADRDAWPYAVDMRGVTVDPRRLVEISRRADGVYLSEYEARGRPALRRVGSLGGCRPATAAVARLGGNVWLLATEVARDGPSSAKPGGHSFSDGDRRDARAAALEVRLCWLHQAVLTSDQTVFVHLFGPDGRQVGGADGDAWLGLLPLADWPSGVAVEDVRELLLAGLPPAEYRLTVGIYDRRTGARLPAWSLATGRRYVDDEVEVARLSVPPVGERAGRRATGSGRRLALRK